MDDLVDQYIEADEDSEKENENRPNLRRQPKTTKDQFDMILAFMENHNEELIDKDTYGSLWDDLAARLNDIGPPDHTVPEWKKIWSAHKYNKNRRRASSLSLDSENPSKSSRLDPPTLGDSRHGTDEIITASEASERIHIPPEMWDKLDVIIDNQNKMIKNQDDIIEELKNSNRVLQEIARKA